MDIDQRRLPGAESRSVARDTSKEKHSKGYTSGQPASGVDHDAFVVGLAEIDRNAWSLGCYAENIRNYAALGDLESLERAIRSAILHVRLMSGEFNALQPHNARGRAA